jgi:ATP-dependent Clp protease ATP-binding subunit ClpA
VFERFTGDSREVVLRARDESRALHHPAVGTAHLLLALLDVPGPAGDALRAHGVTRTAVLPALREVLSRDPSAPAPPPDPTAEAEADAAALAALGFDLDRIRSAVEAAFGPGALDDPEPVRRGRSRHQPFGKDAKKALELALREAVRLKDRHIGTEHVLLGLLRDTDTHAGGVLAVLGVGAADLRRTVEAGRRRSA